MAQQQLQQWLDSLFLSWKTQNPNAIASLCAEKFQWYETPFSAPIQTKEEIVKEWRSILNQERLSLSYTILCLDNTVGIVRWRASFQLKDTGKQMTYDGIYRIVLNSDGKCTEFHQWFNLRK